MAGKRSYLVLFVITLLVSVACTKQSEMTVAYLMPAYDKMKFVNQNGELVHEIEIGKASLFCSWSPESGKIAFTDFDDSLYTINPNGDGLTKITQIIGGMSRLSWSPDGERIAFDTNTAYNNAPFSGREIEIYLIDVDNSDSFRLVAGISPDWSPDGDTITFTSRLTPGGFQHIFKIRIDGTDSIQLTDGYTSQYNPRWSPDGTKIAFISRREYSKGGGSEIYFMDADGSNVTQLTNLSKEKDIRPIDLEWSPSGNQIALLAAGLSMDTFLYIIDVDNSVMQLVASETSMSCPVWIPLSEQTMENAR